MLDLHLHSSFSDGTHSPEALADLARQAGLTGAALCDHDTAGGVPRFLAAARAAGVRALSGVELSLDGVESGTFHLLGYGFDPAHPALGEALDRLRAGREERNRAILARLAEQGFPLEAAEVAREASADGVIGRAHFAAALARRGHVRSRQEAFDRLLARGAPAYVDRFRLTLPAAAGLLHAAGGVAVLAHPHSLNFGSSWLRRSLAEWRAQGLDGLEAYASDEKPSRRRRYLDWARELDLIVTGGSDFHGDATPELRVGRGAGRLRVPDACWNALLERRARYPRAPGG